jgi:hypothetical protein
MNSTKKSSAVQLKSKAAAHNGKRPVAPPVYRPQQAPKVLQTKSALNSGAQVNQATRKPVAPPVYRPEAKKVVQPKAISPQRKTPTAPPVYRPNQKGTAQPKAAPGTRTALAHKPEEHRSVAQLTPAGKTRTPVTGAPNTRASSQRMPIQLNRANESVRRSATPRIAHSATVQRTVSPRERANPLNVRNAVATGKSSVIQRAREMLDYPLNYVMLPDVEMRSYAQHVRMRTKHFFIVVLNAVLEMQRQGGMVSPAMFTDHAKAQEAKGYRLGKEAEVKYDAAHLMNTTLVRKAFKVKSPVVNELYRASAATTTQFQKANVGPDKLIDTQQTHTKNAMLAMIQAGAKVDKAFITHWVTNFLMNIAGALTVPLPENKGVGEQSRAEAFRVAVEEMGNVEAIVDEIIAELPK